MDTVLKEQIKLLVNKPRNLTFLCKKWIHLLTRFLEVPYEGGSSETLSYFAQKSQILRFIYQKLEIIEAACIVMETASNGNRMETESNRARVFRNENRV